MCYRHASRRALSGVAPG